MALFFSFSNDAESARQTAKISLAGSAHVKMSRIWMFAMLKDHPTAAERDHITLCEPCGKAFRASLGVSNFGQGPKDQRPRASEPAASHGKDIPKAVA
jgi:hypothetical protein